MKNEIGRFDMTILNIFWKKTLSIPDCLRFKWNLEMNLNLNLNFIDSYKTFFSNLESTN